MEHQISATLELRDRFTTKIRSATSKLKDFSKSAKNTNNSIRNTANCLQKTAGSIKSFAVGIGGFMAVKSAVGFMGSTLNSFAELEDQVRRNKAIMGASAVEEAKLMEQTKKLGRETKFTAKEVAEAQMYQATAGLKTNEVLELTPKLLKLSIATGEDLARTSDIVTDNISAFGLKLKDADRLMDVMSATANNSNTTVSMLGDAFTYVAASSKRFDSMEEVTAMLGLLANNGIKGAKAGRNLAAIYTRLSKPTKEMNIALKKVNLRLYDQNGKFKGLRSIIKESKVALSKMNEEQRNHWLATVAGAEGIKVWASIMDSSEADVKKLTEAIKNSKGATDKFAKEMGSTTKNKMAEFKSAVDGLKTSIGSGLAPVAIDFMNKWGKKINELNEAEAFSTENLEHYFRTAKDWAEKAVVFYGAVRLAALSATHPFIASAVAAVTGGNYLGKKLAEHFDIEGRATKIFTEHGGSMTMEEAREEAKKQKSYEEKTAHYTPEQREKQTKKGYAILAEAKKEIERKKLNTHLNRNTGMSYTGLRYSDIEKSINNFHGLNKSNENSSTKNTNKTIQNKNEFVINFGGITVNNEVDYNNLKDKFSKDLADIVRSQQLVTQ